MEDARCRGRWTIHKTLGTTLEAAGDAWILNKSWTRIGRCTLRTTLPSSIPGGGRMYTSASNSVSRVAATSQCTRSTSNLAWQLQKVGNAKKPIIQLGQMSLHSLLCLLSCTSPLATNRAVSSLSDFSPIFFSSAALTLQSILDVEEDAGPSTGR